MVVSHVPQNGGFRSISKFLMSFIPAPAVLILHLELCVVFASGLCRNTAGGTQCCPRTLPVCRGGEGGKLQEQEGVQSAWRLCKELLLAKGHFPHPCSPPGRAARNSDWHFLGLGFPARRRVCCRGCFSTSVLISWQSVG